MKILTQVIIISNEFVKCDKLEIRNVIFRCYVIKMVRPVKPNELSHPVGTRRLTTRSNLNTDVTEKYRTEAPKNQKKKTVTPKSLDKELTKKPLTKFNKPNLNDTKTNKPLPRRLFSNIRTQSARPESKNKISMAKSDTGYKRKTDVVLKKYKLNNGRNNIMPPAEKYFISEGKLPTSPRPSKIIGKLITPKLVESRCEHVERELKSKFSEARTLGNSNMSLMAHYYDGLKPIEPNPKKKRIKKVKTTKLKKPKPIKTTTSNLQSDSNTKGLEIKHNDSFVISAKKLLNNPKPQKKPKPDVLKLFKRKDRNNNKTNPNMLKPILKKGTDGKPSQSFGEKDQQLVNRKIKVIGPKTIPDKLIEIK